MSKKKDVKNVEDIESVEVDQELEAKCAEYLDGWKRALADYENLKRDTESRVFKSLYRYESDIFLELLNAMDALEQTECHQPDLSALDKAKRAEIENWLKGVACAHSQLEHVFELHRVHEISSTGKFDPNLHEAVGMRNEKDAADGAILEVVQKGWTLGKGVLRPAMVIVNQVTEDQGSG
ncbi:MAG: nucleotide exchange factor GrpE [bacterium]